MTRSRERLLYSREFVAYREVDAYLEYLLLVDIALSCCADTVGSESTVWTIAPSS